MKKKSQTSVFFLIASVSWCGTWSLQDARASIGRSPEQEALWLLPRLKPVPDEEWAQVAGAKTSEKYEIVKGDTLYDISKRLFGDWRFWPKIWALNNGNITNPHMIRPGNTVAFNAGTGTSLPSIGIRTDGLDSSGPTPAEQGAAQAATGGKGQEEWRKLEGRQSWEVQAPQPPPEVDEQGFDRRSKVAFKQFNGFDLTSIASTEEIEPLGEIIGGRTPGLFFTISDTVFIESHAELQVGQAYAIVHEPYELYSSESGRSGFSYLIQGKVRIIGVKDGTFVGLIESSSSFIERGSKLIPLPPRVSSMTAIAGPSPVEGSVMVDRTTSTATIAQHKLVFIDRGTDDGVREGMVFRAFQHKDPATGDTVTDSDYIITADLMVVQVSERNCSAIVTRSLNPIQDGERVVLLTDVADLTRKRGVREKNLSIDNTHDKELEHLDAIDVSGGLGNKEAKELRELESWKQNGAPLEPGADGKPATDAAKEAGPAPAPGELDEFPASPPGDAPAPAAQPAAAQPAPPTAAQSLEPPGAAPSPETAPSPGELDGPAGDTAPAPVTEAPAPPPAAGSPAPSGASGPESQELENLLNQ